MISMGPKLVPVFGRFVLSKDARASNKTKIRKFELLQTYVIKMSEKCHSVDSVHCNSCRYLRLLIFSYIFIPLHENFQI